MKEYYKNQHKFRYYLDNLYIYHLYECRATILYRMGKFEDALEGFKTAIKLDPANQEFEMALKDCELCLK